MNQNTEAQWEQLMSYINDYVTGSRKESLIKMYEKLADRVLTAPASSHSTRHNCWPGGYIDHVNRVVNCALELYSTWDRLGSNTKNYTKEDIENLLEDYIRIDNIDEVPVNSCIRYVTLDSNKRQTFKEGGKLVSTTDKCVCLSKGTFKWYVKKKHYDKPNDNEVLFETDWRDAGYWQEVKEEIEKSKIELYAA
jgi:hypothetical protein